MWEGIIWSNWIFE